MLWPLPAGVKGTQGLTGEWGGVFGRASTVLPPLLLERQCVGPKRPTVQAKDSTLTPTLRPYPCKQGASNAKSCLPMTQLRCIRLGKVTGPRTPVSQSSGAPGRPSEQSSSPRGGVAGAIRRTSSSALISILLSAEECPPRLPRRSSFAAEEYPLAKELLVLSSSPLC